MRNVVLITAVVLAGCGRPDSTAPATVPDTEPEPAGARVPPPTQLVLAVSSLQPFVGAVIDVTARVVDTAGRAVAPPQVGWSAKPASAVRFDTQQQLPLGAVARITVLEPGLVEITAAAEGKVAIVRLVVPALPPETPALVVERFALHRVTDGFDRGYVMPLLTLREPTGRESVELIGMSASVPTAPPLAGCVTSRTWEPGMTADAFGLSYGDPEFGFGPFEDDDFPLGPIEVVLIVRTANVAVGSIRLSQTIGLSDVTTSIPTTRWTRGIACP
jgi:hypothetical protein